MVLGESDQAGPGPTQRNTARTRSVGSGHRIRRAGDQWQAVRLVQTIVHRRLQLRIVARCQCMDQQAHARGIVNGIRARHLLRHD